MEWTKEAATADTLRALQQCYPDRWERIWDALKLESECDRRAKALAKTIAENPRETVAASAGALFGLAVLSRFLPRRLQTEHLHLQLPETGNGPHRRRRRRR